MRLAAIALFLASVGVARADDAAACAKRGGTWREGQMTGCMVAGQRDGIWLSFYPSGQVDTREAYANGVKAGPSMSFHATCRARSRGNHADGVRDGAWATWGADGERIDEGSYRAGARVGVWKFYEDNELVLEGPMVDDAANGTFTEWFAGGKKWRTVELKDGKRTDERVVACEKRSGTWSVDHGKREEGCIVDRQRDGEWRGYFDDARIAWTANYDGGSETGEHVDYHPTGEVLRRGTYIADIPAGTHEFRGTAGERFGASTVIGGDGAWQQFFPTGKLAEEGRFKGGKREGVWRTYDKRGQMLTEIAWKAGKAHGPFRENYASGELMVEGQFEQGNRANIWIAYYTNGNINWTGAYDESGARTGYWYNGNFNGTPRATGLMTGDLETGGWMMYTTDGALIGVGPYVRGRKQGKWREWWPSGQRWRDVEYMAGSEVDPAARACGALGGRWISDPRERALGCQICRSEKVDDVGEVTALRTGAWSWWHANGVIEKRGTLAAGKREGHWQSWFDNGALMLEGEYHGDRETGPWIGRYRDGGKRFGGIYQDGAREGEWTTLHPDGKTVASTGSYAKDKKVGHWIQHHASGAKKEEGDYTDGKPTGAWTTYHPDGKRASAGNYAAGLRDGVWTWWRPDGSVWRTARYAGGKEVTAP